jgi:hypothetical protein
MSAPALMLALALMAADAPAPTEPPQGEPLPAGAPTQDYPLTAWCYGAMGEYLDVYERVKPDLKAIDKMFGSSEPNEPQPYASDMAAARAELRVLADAVVAAEKASPSPIAPQGAEAVKLGRSIWAPAEAKTSRELARAWLSWALPDRCDSTARALTAKSALLGQALKYNSSSTVTPDTEAAPAATPPSTATTEPPAASPAEAVPNAPVTAPPSPPQPAPATSIESFLASPPPSSAAKDSQPPATGDATPGAEPLPQVAPSPPPTAAPQDQPDPNAPIPDSAPPKP